MGKAFKAFNHGTGKIDLSKHKGIKIMRPVEIHYKEDGSVKDKPSFAIVMTSPFDTPRVGEISLEMLNEGLNEIGYEISKINPLKTEIDLCVDKGIVIGKLLQGSKVEH